MNKPTKKTEQSVLKLDQLTEDQSTPFQKMTDVEIKSIKLMFDRMGNNVELTDIRKRLSDK